MYQFIFLLFYSRLSTSYWQLMFSTLHVSIHYPYNSFFRPVCDRQEERYTVLPSYQGGGGGVGVLLFLVCLDYMMK